jgi:hypothetical protein
VGPAAVLGAAPLRIMNAKKANATAVLIQTPPKAYGMGYRRIFKNVSVTS